MDSRWLVHVSQALQCVCLREVRFHLGNKWPVLLAQEEMDLISLAAVKVADTCGWDASDEPDPLSIERKLEGSAHQNIPTEMSPLPC